MSWEQSADYWQQREEQRAAAEARREHAREVEWKREEWVPMDSEVPAERVTPVRREGVSEKWVPAEREAPVKTCGEGVVR